jgi:hypothetical protein
LVNSSSIYPLKSYIWSFGARVFTWALTWITSCG